MAIWKYAPVAGEEGGLPHQGRPRSMSQDNALAAKRMPFCIGESLGFASLCREGSPAGRHFCCCCKHFIGVRLQ